MAAPAMHVVRIITRMNIGGPSRHAAILSNGLGPPAFTTCLVTGRPSPEEGNMEDLLTPGAARHVRLPSLQRELHPWRDLVTLVRLARLLWRERPDVVHTHMAKAGTLGRVAAFLYNKVGPGRRRPALVVHTFHGHVLDGYFSPGKARLFLGIERWLARRTDALIAVSQAVRDNLLAKGIGQARQWRVIPLGLDLSALAELPPPGDSEPVRFGLVGRLTQIKRPDLFVRGLAALVRDGFAGRATGVIVGDGELRRQLEVDVDRQGMAATVHFAGWQRDLSSVYRNLDVVCLTSENEGTPVALFEAMAAGRAVIAADVGGVRDVVGEPAGEVPAGGFASAPMGLLFRCGDIEGLRAAMQEVITNPRYRQHDRTSTRFMAKTFNTDRLLRSITNLYAELDAEAKACTS